MATEWLTGKYAEQVAGMIGCYDRVIISGYLDPLSYAKGMTKYLYSQNIRIFDYTQFAEPLRDEIRANAERLARENGLEVNFISRSGVVRKEEIIATKPAERGGVPSTEFGWLGHRQTGFGLLPTIFRRRATNLKSRRTGPSTSE